MQRKPITRHWLMYVCGTSIVAAVVGDNVHKIYFPHDSTLHFVLVAVAIGSLVGVLGGLLARSLR